MTPRSRRQLLRFWTRPSRRAGSILIPAAGYQTFLRPPNRARELKPLRSSELVEWNLRARMGHYRV